MDSIFDGSGPQGQTCETAFPHAMVGSTATPESAERTSGSDRPFDSSIISGACRDQAGAGAAAGDSYPILEQLTGTLKSANGPPPRDAEVSGNASAPAGNAGAKQDNTTPSLALADLTLVDPDVSVLFGQEFHLDFDGAAGVTYNGPARVDDVTVPVFRAPGDLAGHERAIITLILADLNQPGELTSLEQIPI